MTKPKYYLKPFWMVVKQFPDHYNKEHKSFYGLDKEKWNCILKENKTPAKVNQFECIIYSGPFPYYFKPVYLTKRLSMESKNIKRG